jgi:hypothetical protein
MEFTLGTDTELFAMSKEGPRALCGLIGGTKHEPTPFHNMPPGFAYQEDNVAVEFNIPPSKTKKQWLSSVQLAFELTKDLVKDKTGFSLSKTCALSFDKTELKHPNALIFGCEPDFDAWKLIENAKPENPDKSLRTAGGHVHVGCDYDMVIGVRNMDLFLGVPSIILDQTEESIRRRGLYGKASAMRPKPYGWEYRTLSNFWVFDPKLIGWVWDSVDKALTFDHKLTYKEGCDITKVINTGNVKKAIDLCKYYSIDVPSLNKE